MVYFPMYTSHKTHLLQMQWLALLCALSTKSPRFSLLVIAHIGCPVRAQK